jgi:hypothetical protein
MTPFTLLLSMYTGFALLMFGTGYIFKTIRERRKNRIAPRLNFRMREGRRAPHREMIPR